MSLKKGTPGQGGEVRAESFSYTSVERGLAKAFYGWLAGPVYWCHAHEHTEKQPGTKPCLDWLTDGALRCPRCRPAVVPTWIGYVPLYREVDGKPIIVIVHESAMDLVAALRFKDYVLVGRVDKNSSVFVRKADTYSLLRSDNERRQRPVDITRDLLSMWRLPQLEQWLLDNRRGVSATQQQGVDDGDALERRDELDSAQPEDAVRRVGGDSVDDLYGDKLADIQRRRNEAFVNEHRNGKPHTNGKKRSE